MTRLDGGAVPPPEAAAPVVCDGPRALMLEAREVPLGGVRGMSVHRSLPQRPLPMVGAWCFLDRFGPQTAKMRVAWSTGPSLRRAETTPSGTPSRTPSSMARMTSSSVAGK